MTASFSPAAVDETISIGGKAHVPGSLREERFGRFILRSVVGKGGFGVVYRAYDDVLEREVALKKPLFAPGDSDAVDRFTRQAKAAAQLRHPNIVVVFDTGNVEGHPFIASEFVHGESLRQRIDRGAIDNRLAAEWV